MMHTRLFINHNICTPVVTVVMETILGLSSSSERARVALYDAAMRKNHIAENDIRFLELYSKLADLTDGEKEEKEEVEF